MTLTLYEHPFAAYCWKPLIALYEREVPFQRHFVGGEDDRRKLAELWPPASIPVLTEDATGLTVPESTPIVEYLDGIGEAAPLVPPEPAAALQARLWDRVLDGHVMTPVQKIVGDNLRSHGRRDEHGVDEARVALDSAHKMLDQRLLTGGWVAGSRFTLADCAAAPALHYAHVVHRWDEDRLGGLTRYFSELMARPSVARVIEEAREYRGLFPMPWPEYAP